jgi:hypothetical protein
VQTIHFILALAIGWVLVSRDLSLPWIALWIVAAASLLTLLTLVVQHRITPAARGRHGLTLFPGQCSWLFFCTIATIVVSAVVVVFIRRRLG